MPLVLKRMMQSRYRARMKIVALAIRNADVA
jgi:hypothetical protein